jgi:acyl carrier protein
MLIEDRVKKLVAKRLGVDINTITLGSRFVEDLGADSLDRVDFILQLEEHFGLKIEDGDADLIKTVNDAVFYIMKHARRTE